VLVEEETAWDELMEADMEQKPKYYQVEDSPKQGQPNGSSLDSPPQSASQPPLTSRGASGGPRLARSLSIESRSTASASPERPTRDLKEKDSAKDTPIHFARGSKR
jgi:hypothetical protein